LLSDWLASLSLPAVGILLLTVMLVPAAIGYYIRKLQRRRPEAEGESAESIAQEGYTLGGVFGLLGLLLAFTFGMVLNRYEERRDLVIKEANAIGTAYLRAQFLDEPHRSRLSALLVEYTETRIQLGLNEGDRRAHLARNDQLLTDIWAAVRASRESALAHGLTTALLISFNEVIDLDAERKVAWELRVPVQVLVLLIIYLAVTAGVAGHQVDGRRGGRAAFVLFLLIAFSTTMIVDINQPLSGAARDSQKPLLDLLQALKSQPPETFDRFHTNQALEPRRPA
jgi:hypothetical protein